MQPHSTHIIYHCAKFGDNQKSFNVIFKKAYISIFLASNVCPMPKNSDIYELWEPVAIVIHTPGRSMYSVYKCNET